ncbi:DNA repair protein RecN [Tumebacillus algifaecis]|uniref:DNA repair protein RecN n=1 Tax=Tumebacillus algifaecis TaxID=1214604 RepID=A0A223D2Y1_9BACL|nr:DNA repair protein RecN [Tumebacillus algifaecis]ASS75930.1 DNA repair protein RecN [Tumebacillus algifaecis]
MLQELTVKNFALIEEVRLSFQTGLCIMTGETGAGKSILLDAVSLILGGRASSEFVRQGKDKATIEALFAVDPSAEFQELFDEYGLEVEDGSILIVREISAAGKNVCRINGRMVTVQMLKNFGQYLINMHGQHEHQTLHDVREQLALIDEYGGEELLRLRAEVETAYFDYRDARNRLREARLGEQERIQRLDILRFQLQEITEVGMREGEDERLEEEHKKMSFSEKLFDAANSSYELLYNGGGRNSTSTLDGVNRVIRELESAVRYDESLFPVLDLVKSSLYQLEEAAHSLRDYRDGIEFNPARLSKIEERLNLINRLKKKYGDTVMEILDFAARIERELHALEHHEESLENLTQNVERTGQVLGKRAVALSKARRQTSEQLSEAVMDELTELMMPKTQFAITFTQIQEVDGLQIGTRKVHVSELGIDRVEFLFSPNVGEPLRPFAKIASGGELSRTMLAIKKILADVDDVGTLIFDEVDTGISGRAAQAVAEKLGLIGLKRQVICVTHLPQVASMADAHYLIQKRQDESRTRTEVTQLNESERVEEIARMLSGAEMTETTLKHAAEMLERASLIKV